MALADIRQFIYYFKYLWSPSDFTNMQTWLQAETRGIAEGAFGGSVLQGIKPSVVSGLTVGFTSGIAVAQDGRIIVFSAANATFASPVGNPAKSLVVLRPKLTNTNNIPEPVNPSNTVPLHQRLEYDLVVIDGTPAANPSYPATQANDVVILGVTLTAGQTNITTSNFDRGAIDVPRKRVHSYRTVSGVATYLAEETEEHLDVDAAASGVTVVLPPAANVPGEDYLVCKIDNSANEVSVSGAGGALLSGETLQTLDSQWQFMKFRSTGTAWRVL